MSFASLKQNRSLAQKKLAEELNKIGKGGQQNKEDENFWKPGVDKVGNGYAVIRFLPAPVGEDWPYVRVWDHGFQGPGGWYIENSLTTLGQDDPVSEYNTTLWNSGSEANKEIARKQKRRLHYISNIQVLHDSADPTNNGKVFLFKYGKKIFDKINDLMNPSFQDEKAINPFDLWEGANFKLKIRMVEGYRNYDKSEFDTPAPLGTDEEMEKVYNMEYSLAKFTDPSRFKTYAELKAKLHKVLGLNAASTQPSAPAPTYKTVTSNVTDEDDAPWNDTSSKSTPAPQEEDEDEYEFFKKLANN